jgi:hypothetical protein
VIGSTPTLFMVLGPPRSGTTVLSDWAMESSGSYCVHEVLPTIEQDATAAEMLQTLRDFARTGADRLEKHGQREFMNWRNVVTEGDPGVLGWKEPLTGGPECELLDPRLTRFMRAYRPRVVLLQRHPVDLVASGARREKTTSNWPGFGIHDMCGFWRQGIALRRSLEAQSWPVLCLRWEEICCEPKKTAASLSSYLGHLIEPTPGRERSAEYLARMRSEVSATHGWHANPGRALVDTRIIADLLGDLVEREGYAL